jgi:hypothetical protein
MKATGWQPHSVRRFLAGVVRQRLKLKLMAAIVVRVGDCSIAMTRACFERASGLLVFGASADCWGGLASCGSRGRTAATARTKIPAGLTLGKSEREKGMRSGRFINDKIEPAAQHGRNQITN